MPSLLDTQPPGHPASWKPSLQASNITLPTRQLLASKNHANTKGSVPWVPVLSLKTLVFILPCPFVSQPTGTSLFSTHSGRGHAENWRTRVKMIMWLGGASKYLLLWIRPHGGQQAPLPATPLGEWAGEPSLGPLFWTTYLFLCCDLDFYVLIFKVSI